MGKLAVVSLRQAVRKCDFLAASGKKTANTVTINMTGG